MRAAELRTVIYHNYFNAFGADDRSRAFHTTSTDGITWDMSATGPIELIGQLSPSGWDDVHVYRPCYIRLADGTETVYYNGLSSTEQIGLMKWTTATAVDPNRWNTTLNSGTVSISSGEGVLTHNVSGTGSPCQIFANTPAPCPGPNMIVETRSKVAALYYGSNAQIHHILVSDGYGAFISDANNHFLFSDSGQGLTRYQWKDAGNWGTETTVWGSFPTTGTWYRSKAAITATHISYIFTDDNGNVLGTGTDGNAPQNFSTYPLEVACRACQAQFDFVRMRSYASPEPSVSVGSEASSAGPLVLVKVSKQTLMVGTHVCFVRM